MPKMTESVESGFFMPAAAASGAPLELAMQRLHLAGRILPAGAHLLVRHHFRSSEKKLIEAVYSFMLPRDASLRRFEVKGRDFAVRSDLKPVKEAVAAYEAGIAGGHLATLAREYRDGLINLSIGNLRPGEDVAVTLEVLAGVELRDDGFRFRFPFTLAPSYHPKARAAEVRPGVGEIELPADLFGDVILPPFHESAEGLHQVSFDLGLEVPWNVQEIASPSHSVSVIRANRVSLAPASEVPNRDLVLDVRAETAGTAVLAGAAEDGRRHFAVVVPSTEFGAATEAPRTVVILLDRSGSMSGVPIRQARKAAAACLSALRPQDMFGLAAFDNECELFEKELRPADRKNRDAALEFLDRIDARGGTELAAGVQAAAGLLGKSGGDIFILTDGQVFGAEQILASARKTGCRLHSLGIGSASQDRFLALLARETHGISRFVTPRERVDAAALELFASVSRPVATSLHLEKAATGTATAPDPPPAVFAGTPVLLFGECSASEIGSLTLKFESAAGSRSLEIAIGAEDNACGETLRLLRGARLITDAEARTETGEAGATGKESRRWEEYLVRLSREYSLASRAMALVAVVDRPGDAPGEPPKTRVVPVGLPQDMEVSGVFDASGAHTLTLGAPPTAPMAAMAREPVSRLRRMFSRDGSRDIEFKLTRKAFHAEPEAEEAESGEFDALLDLSIRLQPDGGMPGKSEKNRIIATLLALLAFMQHGHDARTGAFREHVRKMLDYLDRALPASLATDEVDAARKTVAAARAGRAPEGDWLNLAVRASQGAQEAVDRGRQAVLEWAARTEAER